MLGVDLGQEGVRLRGVHRLGARHRSKTGMCAELYGKNLGHATFSDNRARTLSTAPPVGAGCTRYARCGWCASSAVFDILAAARTGTAPRPVLMGCGQHCHAMLKPRRKDASSTSSLGRAETGVEFTFLKQHCFAICACTKDAEKFNMGATRTVFQPLIRVRAGDETCSL